MPTRSHPYVRVCEGAPSGFVAECKHRKSSEGNPRSACGSWVEKKALPFFLSSLAKDERRTDGEREREQSLAAGRKEDTSTSLSSPLAFFPSMHWSEAPLLSPSTEYGARESPPPLPNSGSGGGVAGSLLRPTDRSVCQRGAKGVVVARGVLGEEGQRGLLKRWLRRESKRGGKRRTVRVL